MIAENYIFIFKKKYLLIKNGYLFFINKTYKNIIKIKIYTIIPIMEQ